MKTTLDRVRENAADIFAVPLNSLTAESSPESIDNWDSVNHLSFILALEQEFDMVFEPSEITQMVTIERAARVIEDKLALA
jgi:acyl carrier protein